MGAAAEAASPISPWGARRRVFSPFDSGSAPEASGLSRAGGSLGAGVPRARGRVQQVEVPGTQLWGPVGGWYLRGSGRKRGRLRTSACLAGLIGAGGGGTGSILVHSPGVPWCEDVETPT